MKTLFEETLAIFQQRNELNIQEGFKPRSLGKASKFNQILLALVQKNLDDTEFKFYKDARKIITKSLKEGRAKNLPQALETILEVERMLCFSSVSFECKLLIGVKYCSCLAYLRLKEKQIDEAEALCLQALAIGHFLIQEHDYYIMEMHRIRQVLNLAMIKSSVNRKEEAFEILFALFWCYEHHPKETELPYAHKLIALKQYYRYTPSSPKPVGENDPFSILGRWKETPISRFKDHKGDNTWPNETLLLLDFSDIPFELRTNMFNSLILEITSCSEKFSSTEWKALLKKYAIHSIEDLRYFKKYQMAYSFLSLKIHAIHEKEEAFLHSLQSFCAFQVFEAQWDTILKDFYQLFPQKELNLS